MTSTNASLIAYLQTVDTPTLSNAIERFKLRPQSAGFAPLGLRCLFPELGRMAGYAVTAQVETVTQMTAAAEEGFHELFEAVEAAPKPAVVVFQEIGGHADYAAHCGEVLATIFSRLGAAGLVSDAGVRDIPEVRAMRFHYFARGAVASHAWFHIVRAGVPVQVLGMAVQPGDLLHGDENGLLQVPPLDLAQIQEAVEAVRTRERRLMDFVGSPAFSLAALRGRFRE